MEEREAAVAEDDDDEDEDDDDDDDEDSEDRLSTLGCGPEGPEGPGDATAGTRREASVTLEEADGEDIKVDTDIITYIIIICNNYI